MILIDSCMFIDCLRAKRDPILEFSTLAAENDLLTCGIVRCEVLRGMRDPRARDRLAGYFDCFCYSPTMNKVWDMAETLVWDLDRQGQVIPLTDVLIACCALQWDAGVLTRDAHFSKVPGLRLINLNV